MSWQTSNLSLRVLCGCFASSVRIRVGFFTETTSFLRNPGIRRSPSNILITTLYKKTFKNSFIFICLSLQETAVHRWEDHPQHPLHQDPHPAPGRVRCGQYRHNHIFTNLGRTWLFSPIKSGFVKKKAKQYSMSHHLPCILIRERGLDLDPKLERCKLISTLWGNFERF